MPRKEIEIAAAHKPPEVGSTKPQSGIMRVAETAGEGVTLGGQHGSAPQQPMNKKMRRATLIKASKTFAAQSANLGEVPERFDKDKYYRVQLTQTVLDHAGNCLRPADDVMVSGSFAEEIGDYISAATEV